MLSHSASAWLLALGLMLGPALAQSSDSLAVAAPADSATVDPTQPQGALQEALEGPSAGRNGAASGQARRTPTTPRPPAMALRARVFAPERAPAALLEVAGDFFFVRAGAVVDLVHEGSTWSLRVVAIGEDGLELAVEPLGKTLVLP